MDLNAQYEVSSIDLCLLCEEQDLNHIRYSCNLISKDK